MLCTSSCGGERETVGCGTDYYITFHDSPLVDERYSIINNRSYYFIHIHRQFEDIAEGDMREIRDTSTI